MQPTVLNPIWQFELSSASKDAKVAFLEGINYILSDEGDAEAKFEEAIRVSPGFVLPHYHLARLRAAKGNFESSQQLIADARKLDLPTPFENSQCNYLELLSLRKTQPAIEQMKQHLAKYNLDLITGILLMQQIFFFGGIGKKEEVLAICKNLKANFDGDYRFDVRHAFHLQEAGLRNLAVALADSTLRVHPNNPYAIHAKIHALMETGKFEDLSTTLRPALVQIHPSAFLYGHLQWHFAVAELAMGKVDSAVESYAKLKTSSNSGQTHLNLADDVGFLWRLRFANFPKGVNWIPKTETLLAKLSNNQTPFVMIHKALYYAYLNDSERFTKLFEEINALANDKYSANMNGILNTLFKAIHYFIEDDLTSAAKSISEVSAESIVAVGGSNIERDLIEQFRIFLNSKSNSSLSNL